MYGSTASCCCPGGSLASAGLPPPASSDSSFVTASVALSAGTSNPTSLSSASSSDATSPSSGLRSFGTSSSSYKRRQRPVLWSRKATLDKISSLFSPLLTLKAGRPRQRFSTVLTSHQSICTTFPFSGDKFCSRTRLCRVVNADANPEVEVGAEELPDEVELWTEGTGGNNSAFRTEHPHTEHSEQQLQRRKLRNRIVFGAGIGTVLLGLVLAGGWVYTLAFSGAIWIGAGEYFELVRSKGNVAGGMTPPPPMAAKFCSAICALMPIATLYYGGRMGVVVTTSAFGLATFLLLQEGPRFSQLTSAIFGLIYCGYLPSFWIKLRCGLNIPALNTRLASGWPVLFGGQAHWTVGLVATIISCSAIAAADTFSFLGGKTLGRTPLIAVSPKKTKEGAIVGLSCTIMVTVLLSKLFQWPASTPSAALLAILLFMSSLFGDLTESVIKRDAGVKDSGHLIPGHGGILDRADSYMFTGALVYSFVKVGVPLFGV